MVDGRRCFGFGLGCAHSYYQHYNYKIYLDLSLWGSSVVGKKE